MIAGKKKIFSRTVRATIPSFKNYFLYLDLILMI